METKNIVIKVIVSVALVAAAVLLLGGVLGSDLLCAVG